jgi:hypothetical protein
MPIAVRRVARLCNNRNDRRQPRSVLPLVPSAQRLVAPIVAVVVQAVVQAVVHGDANETGT